MARLIHLTDLHVSERGTLVSGRLDTRALLSRAIDRIIDRRDQSGPFDAVLVTGDVSDNGNAESYGFACAELARLNLPVLAVPGNHDMRAPFRKAFSRWMTLPGNGLTWTADLGDTRIIGLDTLVEGQGGGHLSDETLDHLSDALATAGTRQIVIAMHHPPLSTGIRFMDAIGLANEKAFSDIVAGISAPIRILAGHVHGVFHGFIGNHSVLTAPAICSAFAFDTRTDAPVGFRTGPTGYAILDTSPRGGTWTAIPLGDGDGPFVF